MASGTIDLGKSKQTEGRILWESKANGAVANTSTVKVTVQIRRWDGNYTTTGTWSGSVTVGSKTENFSQWGQVNSWFTVKTLEVTVSHNSNGTGTCKIAATVNGPTETTQEGARVTGSKTVTLDTILRESIISATDANVESTSIISVTRYNSDFTTTVSYKAAGQSGYTAIWTKQKHSSYGWKIPSSLYSLIPNEKEIDITLQCQTYSGSTLIGTKTCTLTATTSESKCKPDVSVTAVDTNTNTVALTGSNKKIIKGFSDVKVTTTATAKNSASISSVSATCGSAKKTGTSVTFSKAESATIKATANDSRGYSNSATASGLTLIDYIIPTITETISRESPTSDKVNISVKGNWFNGTFGSVVNTLKVEVRYKPKSQSAYADSDKYVEMAVDTSDNTYTATLTLSGLEYTNAYSIRIRVRDAIHVYEGPLAEPVYRNTEISKGVPVFDWGENDFRFNVPLYSGGLNFTQIYQAQSGAAGLGQGESATMQNPTDYHRLYYIRPTVSDGVSPANVYIPCSRVGNVITGVGGYPHASGRIDIFCVSITLATDGTFTVTYCGYWNTATQEYAQRKVNGIFAVL